jgi:hypothetical protein
MAYLPIGANEIRLLRGERKPDGNLHAELNTFSLKTALSLEPFRSSLPSSTVTPGVPLALNKISYHLAATSSKLQGVPPFNALSYTWGSPKYTNSIIIGGERVKVLDSLFPFLELAFEREPAMWWWWIDSLCINQEDNNEKSLQLSLMSSIYRTAKATVGWLGNESEGSDTAIRFLQWLSQNYESLRRGKHEDQSYITKIADRCGNNATKWTAVENFFQRPWLVHHPTLLWEIFGLPRLT